MIKTMTYAHMCKEATEIQILWEPKSGDLYHFNAIINPLLPMMFNADVNGNVISFANTNKKSKFWIPRYEDLIEILENTKDGLYMPYYHMTLDDLLEYTMTLVFNKTWDDENNKWKSI